VGARACTEVPPRRSDFLRRSILNGAMGLSLAACSLMIVAAPASGVSKFGPDTGSGSAFGFQSTGPEAIGPIPHHVILPPSGAPPQTKSVAHYTDPPVVTSGLMTASTSSTDFSLANESITSSAAVTNTMTINWVNGPKSEPITVSDAQTSCTSNANGSSSAVKQLSLKLGSSTVSYPTPLPANYNLPPSQLGNYAGRVFITLNAVDSLNSANSTNISVAAVRIMLLGTVERNETILVAQSTCAASGPDIHPISTIVAESPAAILLPLSGGAAVLALLVLRRRRRLGLNSRI
jgi:hypothetical protein